MATDSRQLNCVCGHSLAAHAGTVLSAGACGFCRCSKFRQPPPTPVSELSEQAREALALLSKSDIFKGVPQAVLVAVAQHGQRRLILANTTLTLAGQPAMEVLVLVKGRVEVRNAGARTVHEAGPGELLGEAGIIDAEPRPDTAVAITDVDVIEISREVLQYAFREFPELLMAAVRRKNRRLRQGQGPAT